MRRKRKSSKEVHATKLQVQSITQAEADAAATAPLPGKGITNTGQTAKKRIRGEIPGIKKQTRRTYVRK